MLVTSNTVYHCLWNNFLSRNPFGRALDSNRLLLLNTVLFNTNNPVADCEPLPFGNPLWYITFCEASKLSHFHRYLIKRPTTSSIQKTISRVNIPETSLVWYISSFVIYISDQILLVFMYFQNLGVYSSLWAIVPHWQKTKWSTEDLVPGCQIISCALADSWAISGFLY